MTEQPGAGRPPGSATGPGGGSGRGGDRTAERSAQPSLSLPKGGGAIRGLGEKVETNAANGTAALSLSLGLSPGRSDFGPGLSLTYDSGAGNGPFGYGWSLTLPSITRKTDKGIPRYADDLESDVFLISGAEDLVPTDEQDEHGAQTRELDGTTYRVRHYRPRIEGVFARIERWTETSTGQLHWRSISRDNVTSLYGTSADSRVSDPQDPARTFQWLLCQRYDDRGNAVVYDYVGEDGAQVDTARPNEANRVRTAQRYLKRVRYGNLTSRLVEPDLTRTRWLFEVVLDYDEGHLRPRPLNPGRTADEQHRYVDVGTEPTQAWRVRPDPFSAYRSAFEVRTYRRCRAVLMFHDFTELGEGPTLVSATEIDYHDLHQGAGRPRVLEQWAHQGSTEFASMIRSITRSGYIRQVDGGYLAKSMPPLEFTYSTAELGTEVRELDRDSLANLPAGLDGATYQWADLDGDGAPGILTEQADAWFYKSNLGCGRFGSVRMLAKPASAHLGMRQQLLDLDGDGRLEIVSLDGPTPGSYERTDDGGWAPFTPFAHRPVLNWADPNLTLTDLTGDGRADVLVTCDDEIVWYPSLGSDGFGPAHRVHLPHDEEQGPRLVFADGTQSIYRADMSGDGLTDIVRVRNGSICYWPALGYGRFGAKVTMDRSPVFDEPDQFSQRQIRLADVDGSGTTDIVYLGRRGVTLHLNQSGNGWAEPLPLPTFPPSDDRTSVMVVDLLGTATACLVWSSPLPGDTRRPLRYLELMRQGKPRLLTRCVNNLGGETELEYTPSTTFALADKQAGRPWRTRLPFPVHVVSRTRTHDRVGRSTLTTTSAYHDGYFDGPEREFRGFGFVEQWDAEKSAALGGAEPGEVAGTDLPPVYTKTWFHTGAPLPPDSGGFYHEPGWCDADVRDHCLGDELPPHLSADERREAQRALKGAMLRQEVYAADGSVREQHPYTVTEQTFSVAVLQRRGARTHAVMLRKPFETIKYQYERSPLDPRISHRIALRVDDFGNVLAEVVIAYGRRCPDPALPPQDQTVQATTLITYIENEVTVAVTGPDDHRLPLPSQSSTWEVTGLVRGSGQHRLSPALVADDAAVATEIGYEQRPAPGTATRRLVERVRTLYRSDDLSGALPFGGLESRALPYDSYQLAFTPALLAAVYAGRVGPGELREGGYVQDGDDWWIPSGQQFYAETDADELAVAMEHFFLPRRYRSPFHTPSVPVESLVGYDQYDLLVLSTRDAIGNVSTAETTGNDVTMPRLDYRVLQPYWTTDPNGNRSQVVFDALGRVAGSAVMGKPGPALAEGDSLGGLAVELTPAETLQFIDDPTAHAAQLLGPATSRFIYDLDSFRRSRDSNVPQPVVSATLSREEHSHDRLGPVPIQLRFGYSDGLGREIQVKSVAEPAADADRWLGSAWIVYNNKGKPVRRFEPFYGATHRFEFDLRSGVSPVLVYDPVERMVATLNPDHTWLKVVFDAWRQETWDLNDTVLTDPSLDPDVGPLVARMPRDDYLPTWYEQRRTGELGEQERIAAEHAAAHAATPTLAYADALGRTVRTVTHNRVGAGADSRDEFLPATHDLDVEGNELSVRDALGRLVARYAYDLAGHRIHLATLDQGERRMLGDVTANAIRVWDSRGHVVSTEYDVLRRVLRIAVTGADLADPTATTLVERRGYGEQHPDAVARNLRGELYLVLDQSGATGNESYDFKGNLLRVSRRIATDFVRAVSWADADAVLSAPGALDLGALAHVVAARVDDENYPGRTRYDALNRPTTIVTADGSRIRLHYNRTRLLDRVELSSASTRVRGRQVWRPIVTTIEYDPHGKRTRVDRSNGASTLSEYDPVTGRLRRMLTLRTTVDRGRRRLQDLRYAYDPTGNVTHVTDDAQQRIFFRNRRVEPSASYVYDATYQLVRATGREHLGQSGGEPVPHSPHDERRVGLPQPGDGTAMATYVETYEYDDAGNLLAMHHRGSVPGHDGWTREYEYDGASQLEPDRTGNRLTRSWVAGDPLAADVFGYDEHGNLTVLPHLAGPAGPGTLAWDVRDHLVRADLPDGSAYYVYDSAGERTRKVVEHRSGRREERLYLGALEVFRRRHADGSLALERVSLDITDERVRFALVETRTVGDDDSPAHVVRHQFGNHLGSVALELDGAGRVISYEEYSPYGSTTYQAVRQGTETPKRYRFTAMERDEETGLNYHLARYYAPWLARWTAGDPIGLDGGMNVYRYVSGNPTSGVDPSGLGFWGHVWGGVKTVGGVLETAAGVAIVGAGVATSEFGVGVALIAAGSFVTAHGADTTVSGARQLVTGEHADTLTATGLQAAGMSKSTANLVDAGISVVATLGASAVTKAPTVAVAATDAVNEAAFVHRTTAASAELINESATLGKGASTVYAGPASLADASGLGITLRTGLLPSQAGAVVNIPGSAANAFRIPAVVGPFTAWQRAFGTVYTAGAGSINLTTGVFARTGPAWNQIFLYGVDASFNALARGGQLTTVDDTPSGFTGTSDPLSVDSPTRTVVLDPSATAFGDSSSGQSIGSDVADPPDLTQQEIDAQACLVPAPL